MVVNRAEEVVCHQAPEMVNNNSYSQKTCTHNLNPQLKKTLTNTA